MDGNRVASGVGIEEKVGDETDQTIDTGRGPDEEDRMSRLHDVIMAGVEQGSLIKKGGSK